MSRIRQNRRWWSTLSVFTVITTVIFMLFPGIALAQDPPIIAGQNPSLDDPAGASDGLGPQTIVSDESGGDCSPDPGLQPCTDGTYHLVARVSDDDADVTLVEARVDDHDNDSIEDDAVIAMTQVGSTDTWEAFWDIPASIVDTDDNAGPAEIVFFVEDSLDLSDDDTVPVTIDTHPNTSADTVEITSPPNGGDLGFFDNGNDNPQAIMSGTASEPGTNSVDLYYSSSTAEDAPPDWIECGSGFPVADDGTWSGLCELRSETAVDDVAMVAARDFPNGGESGDAHRIAPYEQEVSGLDVTPASDAQTAGFCNTFTAHAFDQFDAPIGDFNIDVHADGPDFSGAAFGFPRPADQYPYNFATNNAIEGDESDPFRSANNDDPFHSPTAVGARECDREVDSQEPDGAPDDDDGGDPSTIHPKGTPGTVSPHVLNDSPFQTVTALHIEGETGTDGNFDFSLVVPHVNAFDDTDPPGDPMLIDIFVWGERENELNEDVFDDGFEPNDSADKTFETPTATTIDAEPESDLNFLTVNDDVHEVTATVYDQNENPMSGVVVHFRVFSGPNSNENLDDDPLTPAGYFEDDFGSSECVTGEDGQGSCRAEYEEYNSSPARPASDNNEEGVDQIQVWFGGSPNTHPLPREAAAGNPESTTSEQQQDVVTKQWVDNIEATCIDLEPNFADNSVADIHELQAEVTDGDPLNDFNNFDFDDTFDCDGNTIEGAIVQFQITDDVPDAALINPDDDGDGFDQQPVNDGDGGVEDSERVLTDATGIATIDLDNVNDWIVDDDQNSVRASTPGADGEALDFATKTWHEPGFPEEFDCQPDRDTNLIGQNHALVATVTDFFGDPVEGVEVDFEVSSGPHADNNLGFGGNPGYFGEDETDANGEATRSYTGPEEGEDDITCWVEDEDFQDGDDNAEYNGENLADFPTKTWTTAPKVAGGEVAIDMVNTDFDSNGHDDNNQDDCFNQNGQLSPSQFGSEGDDAFGGLWNATSTNIVGHTHTVCVSARDSDGDVLYGHEATLTHTGGVGTLTDDDGPPPTDTSQSALIDVNGFARFVIFSNVVGTQNLSASVEGVTDTDEGEKEWIAADPRNIGGTGDSETDSSEQTCQPPTDTNPPETDHEVVCTITDGLNNPVPGVTVEWTKQEFDGASSAFQQVTTVSDSQGEVRASINSPTEGRTVVQVRMLDPNPGFGDIECDEEAGGPDPEDVDKPAGNCIATAEKIWTTGPILADVDFILNWYDGIHPGTPDWVLVANYAANSRNARIQIPDPQVGDPVDETLELGPNEIWTPQFPGIMGGPVFISLDGEGEAAASLRSLWYSGNDENFEEVGARANDDVFTTHYWPWYDGLATDGRDWIHVINPNAGNITVDIQIAGTLYVNDAVIGPNSNFNFNFPGVIGGPVVVTTSGPTLASQRVLWDVVNFSETPSMQLTTDVRFPWYDYPGSGGRNWVVVGNPGGVDVSATISIAGVSQGAFNVPAGTSIFPTFPGVIGGPVRVTSTGPVVVSERTLWNNWSLEEVPGSEPKTVATFTWYDAFGTNDRNWILVANVGAASTNVEIFIGGVLRLQDTLSPGEIITPKFPLVIGGPVEVTSSQPNSIITSERSLWGPRDDFTELVPSVDP